MTTTANIQTKHDKFQLKAFTLLESLICLFLLSFLAISLSGPITDSLRSVEEGLFFLSFEGIYQDSQKMSVAKQEDVQLRVGQTEISNGYMTVAVPKSVRVVKSWTVTFDPSGGNSSLAKMTFETPDKTVQYQLYLGSGKYQKTVR